MDISGTTEDSSMIGFEGVGSSSRLAISFSSASEVSSSTDDKGTTTAKYEVTPTTTLTRTIEYILGSRSNTETKTQAVIKFTLTCSCE